jgi:hypothetical protein
MVEQLDLRYLIDTLVDIAQVPTDVPHKRQDKHGFSLETHRQAAIGWLSCWGSSL